MVTKWIGRLKHESHDYGMYKISRLKTLGQFEYSLFWWKLKIIKKLLLIGRVLFIGLNALVQKKTKKKRQCKRKEPKRTLYENKYECC